MASSPANLRMEAIEDRENSTDILSACNTRDFKELRRIAQRPGGFLSDGIRWRTWPVVLGVPTTDLTEGNEISSEMALVMESWDKISWKDLQPHRDEEQVKKDTDRAFVGFKFDEGDAALERCKGELQDLILEVLRRYPYLHYFQGFHDICQIFYLVLPPRLRAPAVARLAITRIRDFMLPRIEVMQPQLDLITAIVQAADPELSAHITAAFHTAPAANRSYWAMPVTLTMFAHQISSLRDITRLFDALLACEPAFAPYLVAALVIGKRDSLMPGEKDPGDHLDDLDDADAMAIRLQNLARTDDIEVDALVIRAEELFKRLPPSTATELRKAWRAVPRCSCLKTALNPEAAASQTMQEGEAFWKEQKAEMIKARRRMQRRETLKWLFKRATGPSPARTLVMVGVAVGITAYWMQRHPGTVSWAYQRVVGFGGAAFGPAGR